MRRTSGGMAKLLWQCVIAFALAACGGDGGGAPTATYTVSASNGNLAVACTAGSRSTQPERPFML
jgi:hypothetical protein